MPFESIDTYGDAGIRAFGSNCQEAFINAGLGMFNLITEREKVDIKKSIQIEIHADTLEGLLVRYLNELIFQFDTYGFIGKQIEFVSSAPEGLCTGPSQDSAQERSMPDYRIKVKVSGEDFDLERHEQRLLIKAATYHNLKVKKIDGGWEIEAIFDV